MNKSTPKGPDPEPDDDRDAERRDVDLPQPQHLPAGVHRFRQLLAELIARRIREKHRRPPDSGESSKS